MQDEDTLIGRVARHPVAPNVLMLILIVAGLWAVTQMNIRFFPKFDIQFVLVTVPWPGASAEDVEKSLIVPLENQLRSVPNVDKITTSSNDGAGVAILEFPQDADLDRAAEDVKQYVDQAAGSLPTDSETPEVTKIANNDPLLKIALTGGDLGELRRLARRYETELTRLGVAKVEVTGLPREEIQIVVDRKRLVELGATVRDIGARIAAHNRDISAGDVEVGLVDARLRALAKSEDLFGLAEVPALPAGDGRILRLGDIADIRRVVPDGEKSMTFNGQTAVQLELLAREQDSTLESADAIRRWAEETRATLPPGVQLRIYNEDWRYVESRLALLLKNGAQGLFLVLLILFLFLNGRVAFWVAAGIPAIFLATLFVMENTGGTINMISMFALIMATGIIVDDAVVVGENAAHHLRRGESPLRAAVHGAREMFAPVFASTFTTVSSFLPLFVIGGIIGSIVRDIPAVIVCILIAAVFECFLILPGHLYHAFSGMRTSGTGALRQKLEGGFVFFQERIFRPAAAAAVKFRLPTLAVCAGMVIFSVALFVGGQVKFRFFPSAEFNIIQANVVFAAGTSETRVRDYVAHLVETLGRAEKMHPEEENLIRYVAAQHGAGGSEQSPQSGAELAQLHVEMSSAEDRKLLVAEFIKTWRGLVETPAGLERLSFQEASSGPPGADLEVRLTGENVEVLKTASLELQDAMSGVAGVSQIRDDTPYGKDQLTFELTPLGGALGLSTQDVATQLRDALDGFEAQTFYEAADEVQVRVLQSGAETTGRLASFQVRLPNGDFAALEDVADFRGQRGFDSISRINGRPAINVVGEVDFAVVNNVQDIINQLESGVLPDLASRHGVEWSFEGQQADQRQTIDDMLVGLVIALVLIYIILTWVFASWSIPLVIMLTMPLGVIGAVVGHWLMGKEMSILSFFGVFALMGIIVNDSIVLVQYYQLLRREEPNERPDRHIVDAACRRLRAVLVTSLTTIGGLLPLMFETSPQAQFLIPMAISVCFGLMFATLLILLFTPACLSYHQQAAAFLRNMRERTGFPFGAPRPPAPAEN